jgi:5'-AMP-activated protein kinase catalytic alpha subunit
VAQLIEKMLTVDPMKRATIKDIRESDWFKINLPDYLFPKPTPENLSIIDIDAVFEICEKFGVDEQTVQRSLSLADPHDQYVIAYHLIIDNKRISEAQNRVQINDFFVASSPPTTSFFMDMNVKSLNANVMSNLKTASRRLSESEKRTTEQTSTNQTSQLREHPERMPQLKDVTAALDAVEAKQNEQEPSKKPVKKAKWHLGIRSQSKPQDIMNEVFKAMKNNSMQWKYYNSSMYNLRVRKPVGQNRYVKIGLQLYQVDQKSYLLDFRFFDQQTEDTNETEEQKSLNREVGNHNVMEFFELCADLIGSLAR